MFPIAPGSILLILFALSRLVTGEATEEATREVPRKVWVFWFGKEMHGARKVAYHSLLSNIGVEVELVTVKDLHRFNVSTHPFHKAIRFPLGNGLSAIHVGDYLRAYFMHHYGGGYHDVKRHDAGGSWAPFFDVIEKDPNIWVLYSCHFA